MPKKTKKIISKQVIESENLIRLREAFAKEEVLGEAQVIPESWLVANSEGKTPLQEWLYTEEPSTLFCAYLVKKGISLSHQDNQGQTIIHQAITRCRIDVLKILFDHDPYALLYPDSLSIKPYIYSLALKNSTEQILATHLSVKFTPVYKQSLIETHSFILQKMLETYEQKQSLDFHPLYYGCIYHDVSILKFLLDKEHFTLETQMIQGMTPAMITAQHGNLPCLQFLMSQGANMDARDDFGRHSLHLCAARNQSDDVINFLVQEAHQNINTLTPSDDNALFYAMSYGHLDNARTLIALGCNPLHRNRHGESIPHFALMENKEDQCIQFLNEINHPSLLEARACDGITLAHIAASKGQLKFLQWLEQDEQRKFLLEQKNSSDLSPLHISIQSNQLQTAEWLVAHSPPKHQDIPGLLSCAIKSKKLSTLEAVMHYIPESLIGTITNLHLKCMRDAFIVFKQIKQSITNEMQHNIEHEQVVMMFDYFLHHVEKTSSSELLADFLSKFLSTEGAYAFVFKSKTTSILKITISLLQKENLDLSIPISFLKEALLGWRQYQHKREEIENIIERLISYIREHNDLYTILVGEARLLDALPWLVKENKINKDDINWLDLVTNQTQAVKKLITLNIIKTDTLLEQKTYLLHLALGAENIDLVTWLLERKSDIMLKDIEGRTFINCVVNSMQRDNMIHLIEKNYGHEAIIGLILASCDSSLFHYLLSESQIPNLFQETRYELLKNALKNNNIEIVNLFIEQESDFGNSLDSLKEALLHTQDQAIKALLMTKIAKLEEEAALVRAETEAREESLEKRVALILTPEHILDAISINPDGSVNIKLLKELKIHRDHESYTQLEEVFKRCHEAEHQLSVAIEKDQYKLVYHLIRIPAFVSIFKESINRALVEALTQDRFKIAKRFLMDIAKEDWINETLQESIIVAMEKDVSQFEESQLTDLAECIELLREYPCVYEEALDTTKDNDEILSDEDITNEYLEMDQTSSHQHMSSFLNPYDTPRSDLYWQQPVMTYIPVVPLFMPILVMPIQILVDPHEIYTLIIEGQAQRLNSILQQQSIQESIFEEVLKNLYFLAIEYNQEEALNILLSTVRPQSSLNNYFNWLLCKASAKGLTSIVDQLLSLDFISASANFYGNRALRWAAYYGHASIVQRLLALPSTQREINTHNNYALRWSIKNAHADVVYVLLNQMLQNGYSVDLMHLKNTIILMNRHYKKLIEFREFDIDQESCKIEKDLFNRYLQIRTHLLHVPEVLQKAVSQSLSQAQLYTKSLMHFTKNYINQFDEKRPLEPQDFIFCDVIIKFCRGQDSSHNECKRYLTSLLKHPLLAAIHTPQSSLQAMRADSADAREVIFTNRSGATRALDATLARSSHLLKK